MARPVLIFSLRRKDQTQKKTFLEKQKTQSLLRQDIVKGVVQDIINVKIETLVVEQQEAQVRSDVMPNMFKGVKFQTKAHIT